MRTKIFLAVVLTGMLSVATINASSKLNANESSVKGIEKTDLEVGSKLQKIFQVTPIADFTDTEETIQVRFSINEKNEMTNIKVNGKNKELANYVYQVLTREKVTLVNANPDNYNINLVFDIK